MRKSQINKELIFTIIDTVPDDYDITCIDLRNNNLRVVMEYDLSEWEKFQREQAYKRFGEEWQEYIKECDEKLKKSLEQESNK